MALGIALPTWLVAAGNANKVLFLYAMIFGIGLPYLVSRWWTESRRFTKDSILNDTMGNFYKELKETIPLKGESIVESNSSFFYLRLYSGWKLKN